MSYKNTMSGTLSDYTHLRTLPALLSVVFVMAGLYQFGGISDVTLVWLDNYTLTTQHAMFIAIGSYALAFMSSETKSFDHYEDWEKGAILLGPVVFIGNEHVQFITDLIATEGNVGPIVAFAITVVAWGVAVR